MPPGFKDLSALKKEIAEEIKSEMGSEIESLKQELKDLKEEIHYQSIIISRLENILGKGRLL